MEPIPKFPKSPDVTRDDIQKKTIDTEAPVVNDNTLKVSGLQCDRFTLKWEQATDKATSKRSILYGIMLGEEGKDPACKALKAGIGSYTFTGLQPGRKYVAVVYAADKAGNSLQYAPVSVRTPEQADLTPPTASSTVLRVVHVTGDSITIEWNPATDNVTPVDRIMYKVFLKETARAEPWQTVFEKAGLASYTFTGLKEGVWYSFYVQATDEAGNTWFYNADGGTYAARTLDVTPPTLPSSGVKVSDITAHGFKLSWAGATDNLTEKEKILATVILTQQYNPDDPGWTVIDRQAITSFTFTGLKEATYYLCHIRLTDESGNEKSFPNKSVKTLETTPPTVNPKSVKVTKTTTTSFTLAWDAASDNVTKQDNMKYYVLYKENSNNDPFQRSKEVRGKTGCTVTGLKPGTTYAFYIEARDEDGNTADFLKDNKYCFLATTEDDQTPVFKYGAVINVLYLTHSSVTLGWEAAEDNLTPPERMEYQVWFKGGRAKNWTNYDADSFKGRTTYTPYNLNPGTKYQFYVLAIDESGNETRSETLTVWTKPAPVRKLTMDIDQDAEPLQGTDSIRLTVDYEYVQLDKYGCPYNSKYGTWQETWCDYHNKTGIINLPKDCYFKDNRVKMTLKRRITVLSKWEDCCSGRVDVSGGKLRILIEGHYLKKKSIKLGGSADKGYAHFLPE